MIICSSFCSNYAPKAAVLAESVKKYNLEAITIACVLERELTEEVKHTLRHFDQIVQAKDLGYDDFDAFIFKYDIVEASTAVKGKLFQYLMDRYPKEKYIYLDPDIKVYHSLEQLDIWLDSHPILLTPHLLTPESFHNARGIFENEIGAALTHGVFNLGFLAVNSDVEARRFIDWWARRLELYCYADMKDQGIFTDQGWIDLAPCFFEVFIIKNSGYNVAHWNLSTRILDRGDRNVAYTVNGEPLIFYHFSEFTSGLDQSRVERYASSPDNAVYEVRDVYSKDLERFNQAAISKIPWSYSTYLSGEKISKEVRAAYRRTPELMERFQQPFEYSNAQLVCILPIESEGRPIYIWGAGEGGQRTHRFYRQLGIEVTGFLDRDSKKAGTFVNNIQVYDVNEWLEQIPHMETALRPFILIGTMHFESIGRELQERGYENNCDYIASVVI